MLTITHLALIRQTFASLDVEIPADLADQITDLEALRHSSRELTDVAAPSLGTAIATALKAGRDPVTDKGVQRALGVRAFLAARPDEALADYLDTAVGELLDRHRDGIIEALVPVVEHADEALTEARDLIPELNLRDTGSLSRLAPRQLAAWGQARDMLARVEKVAKLWQVIHPTPPHRRPLILADLDADELTALGHQPAAVEAAHAGHPLALATPAEFAERCARIADSDGAAAERQTQADRAQVKRRYGFGKVAS